MTDSYQSIFDVGAAAQAHAADAKGQPSAAPQQQQGGYKSIFEPPQEPVDNTPWYEKAISGVVPEMARAAGEHFDTVNQTLGPNKDVDTSFLAPITQGGRGLLSAATALPDIAIGAPVRSLIGHPLAAADQALFGGVTGIPGQKETPDQTYERWRGNVDLALSAARPAGIGPGSAPPPLNTKIVPSSPAPTTEHLFDAADNLYDVARNSGVQIKPSGLADAVDEIKSRMRAEGFHGRQGSGKGAFESLDDLPEFVGDNGLSDVGHVHSIMKELRLLSKQPGGEGAAAGMARNELFNYLDELPTTRADDLASSSPKEAQRAVSALSEANTAYGTAMRSETIENAIVRALDRSGNTGTGDNFDNALRQEMGRILKNRNLLRGFSQDQIDEIRAIDRGDIKSNILRRLAKWAPSGVISGMGSLGLGMALAKTFGTKGITRGVLEAAPAVAGTVAKKMAEARTLTRAQNLGESVRGTAGPTATRVTIDVPKKNYVLAPGALAPLLSRTTEPSS